MIGRQSKTQFVYMAGKGQQNSTQINDTLYLSEGNYNMIVEIEVPNDDLIGVDLKLKVSLMISETYFMISSKYND